MPDFSRLAVDDELPTLSHTPDNVQLFMYNAALWNAHRIHFDLPYATEVEGYPGLVIAGPMMGDWLGQCVEHWLDGSGRLVQIEYSNRQAAYIGETLRSTGRVTALHADTQQVELALAVVNEQSDVITPGTATVQLG